jgi:hypothetical protein
MFRLPARRHAGWLPPALRWWNLVIATLLCWTFIALLLTFFNISRANGGIIFAPKINDLPLRQTFVYLYLPTIIATIFSVFIVWIDVDAKRFEPYYQLSMPNGARGKDSLLLQYPYDLLPVVPFKALRNRYADGSFFPTRCCNKFCSMSQAKQPLQVVLKLYVNF